MDSPQQPPSDSVEWIAYYLTVHSLSIPSRRYSFILWLAVVLIFLVFGVLHWTGSRGGVFGAVWSKWALRRRTWRKKHTLAVAQHTNQPHRQPISLPSNAQLLSLTVLGLASLALAFVGPDYLAPTLKVWQMQARASSPSQLDDTSAFIPYMPNYTISKSLWTSSARVGQIAFALLPLCVLFALKAPPFAIFAIPFMTQLYFDKLAWLHKWAGRLIWFLTSIHVALWSIQLSKDVNSSTGRVVYVYAWSYTPFIYGWVAFALLTFIILLSVHPIRRRFYEHFYILHLLLVPSMLVMAGLHHPTVAWWCWGALGLWIGERLWRGTWWIYANGIVGGAHTPSLPLSDVKEPSDAWELNHIPSSSGVSALALPPLDARASSPLYDYYTYDDKSPVSPNHDVRVSEARLLASPPHPAERTLFRTSITSLSSPFIPPPGYVHAEILSGRTVRLRIITPGYMPWSPGQHFLLNIPSISRLTSHPFTCASVCDEEAPTDAGRIMLFLVRAKGGWTQDLWDLVSRLTAERSRGGSPRMTSENLPKNGVLLRAYVDGPFGSSKRARWGNYSSAVIITGGSGVSFGLSILQYTSMCLAGRDGRHLGGRPGGWGRKGADLKRVRFVWLVREYSHVQWCASILRYCTSIAPSSALQIDIFVTNFKPLPPKHISPSVPPRARFHRVSADSDDELRPPHPNFIHKDSDHLRSGSTDSVESHESYESDADLNYYLGESPEDEPPADDIRVAHEANILDLTNFDGDVEMTLPGEVHLNHRLKKEGKLRRMQSQSRRQSTAKETKPDGRLLHPPSEMRTPRHEDPRQAHPTRLMSRTSSRLPRVPQTQNPLTLSTKSTDKLLPNSPLSERVLSPPPDTDPVSPLSLNSNSPLVSRPLPHLASPTSDVPPSASLVGARGATVHPAKPHPNVHSEPGKSLARQIPPTLQVTEFHSPAHSPCTPGGSDGDLPFQMDDQEAADVNAVSEHARPGKPKLDKVIADEVHASKGAVVVACCGPTSLNAMVRKIVAAQIDPERIRKGDMRSSITLVSEEFEY